MKKKVLVTGGAGYIGSHVVKQLGKNGYDIVVVDNLSTGNKDAVKFGELVECDLSNLGLLNEVFEKEKFDSVLHFAGSIIVPESVENPSLYYQNNTINSKNLIDLCIKHKVKNFIFSSTAAVYGELQGGYAVEDLPKSPINPYGWSKLMTEQMLKDYSNAHDGFNFVALRYFNVAGADPEGQIGQAFPGATHLIKVNCEAATGKREKVLVFGNDFDTKDGTGVRDYIHVVDLADAHICALKYLEEKKKSEILNCGYGHGYSVLEVIDVVKKISNTDYKVETVARRDGDPAILVSKIDKIHSLLDWKPQFDDLNVIVKTAYDWESSSTLKSWREKK